MLSDVESRLSKIEDRLRVLENITMHSDISVSRSSELDRPDVKIDVETVQEEFQPVGRR